MNHIKTMFLMVLLTAVLLLVGGAIAGEEGIIFAFIIAMIMNFGSYWYSDKIAVKMTRSQPLKESDAPEVYRAMRELVTNADMPMPKIIYNAYRSA